jgi:hypothetical protein
LNLNTIIKEAFITIKNTEYENEDGTGNDKTGYCNGPDCRDINDILFRSRIFLPCKKEKERKGEQVNRLTRM